MKTAVAADLHFGRGGERGVTQYRESFREMIDGIISHGVHVAIFAGDTFNRWSWFNPRTFCIVAEGIRRLREKNIVVIMLAGNHDYDLAGTEPAIAPFADLGARIVTEPEWIPLGIGGTPEILNIFAVPWITKGMALKAGLNLKTDVESINEQIAKHFVFPQLKNPDPAQDSLLIFHASIFGMDMGSSTCVSGVDFTLNPDWLNGRGFNHIIGGHFHRRQKKDGIHYVGSMERQTFGERDNPCGWMLLDGKEYEFIELEKPMRFVEISFDLTEEFTSGQPPITDFTIGVDVKNAAVKVKYRMRKNDPFDRARLLRELYGAGALSVIMEVEYIEEIQLRTQEIKAEQDILTQFKIWKEMNPDKDADGELEALLMRELQNSFPDDVDKSYLTGMMNGGKR